MALLHLAIVACLTVALAGDRVWRASRPALASPGLTRLTPCGRALCSDDGSRFRWRGITAFALLDLIADGKDQEARAFLQWAHQERFTVVRVLAMNPNGWFDLAAADGRRALPALLRLAADYQLHVQVVALANTTARSGDELRDQVRGIGQLCASADNCLLEIANEPYHSSQAKLQDPALMQAFQRLVPGTVVTAWGAASDYRSDVMAGGTYVVAHVARSGERWTRVSRVRDLAALSRQTGKFVVDNEPIGAAERAERSRRDTVPAAFFAQGALARLLEVGSTFHCSDCLQARVPGPIQKACAKAFIAGSTIVPDAAILAEIDERTPDVATLRRNLEPFGSHAFAAVSRDRGWLALVGDVSDRGPIWTGPWTLDKRIADQPGVSVWTFRHRKNVD